jgi:adenylylsulfate kinase
LTGISGAGKTTLANEVKALFEKKGLPIEVLDGDQVRSFFENDLVYSRNERIANVRRITFAAYLLAKHGVNVIVANIAPYRDVRQFIRKKLEPGYVQVYVKAPIELVKKRDVQGHYAKHQAGTMTELIGVDDGYDEPARPDVVCDTQNETVPESVEKIAGFLRKRGIAL